MKVLVTGGAGFIGSHVCEYYAKQGHQVIAIDNLSRASLLKKSKANTAYNWEFLRSFPSVKRYQHDIGDFNFVKKMVRGVNIIVHTAAQTAVTTSVTNPIPDFKSNVIGTFHILEAARQVSPKASIVICSTNKVYGENVNQVKTCSLKTRYAFEDKYKSGIPENFGIDLCEHTPYGCSKLAADIYAQDYARLYGLKVGVFRMSCIYGIRQFGVEDQGWLAWFVIAAVTGQQVTIYGDGKQVRDILWVGDLVKAFAKFAESKHRSLVVNMGGGENHTLSLLELINTLKREDFPLKFKFSNWRPSDQKVYISNIKHASQLLRWKPDVSPREGVRRLINWVQQNRKLFVAPKN